MKAYIIRRLMQTVLVLIGASMLVFVIMRLLPGDPILMYISRDELGEAGEQKIAMLRHEFGLDKPTSLQYVDWMKGVLRGDLGTSIIHRTSVTKEISGSLPKTFYLGSIAFLLSIIIGIPVGVICAVRRAQWIDTAMTVFANIGITVPIFWLGILMIYLFGLELDWLPIFGYTSPFDDFWLSTKQAIMPVICLSVFSIASTARQTRSAMLEVIQQDYIRTAWSKGLQERVVILRHALKNSLIPVLTLKGMTLRTIVGGSVLVETVFNIPGMGRLAVEGLFTHDYAIIQGVILIIAFVVSIANLAVDFAYAWADPRIRYS
jgi:peptide/nickel transport system permease protein